MRFIGNHVGLIHRVEEVAFLVDGEEVRGRPGESVALALHRAGRQRLRSAPADGAPRGMFCCMGLCQECAVVVDGGVVEGCRLEVRAGLAIETVGRGW